MTKAFVCDHCEGTYPTVPFELVQSTDEVDEDGDQIDLLLHLCSVACLADFAMSLSLLEDATP